MSELLIDVGNSAAKWAIFDGHTLNSNRHSGSFSELAEALWLAAADAGAVWVASVRGESSDQSLVVELQGSGLLQSASLRLGAARGRFAQQLCRALAYGGRSVVRYAWG